MTSMRVTQNCSLCSRNWLAFRQGFLNINASLSSDKDHTEAITEQGGKGSC
jgi:hypothetical protein